MANKAASNITRKRSAFVLAIGFLVLLSSAVWLYWTVKGASDYQRDVRLTQRARNLVFLGLLDQETSVRGFTSTREIIFLTPYGQAQAMTDHQFADLQSRLKKLGTPQLVPLVDDEIALQKSWHDRVAAPLIAEPDRRDALRLHIIGMKLVDAFRSDDHRLDDGINQAAVNADSAVNVAVLRISIVTSFLGLCFAVAYWLFTAQRTRMLAEASRQRMLYENEKSIADALQAAFVQKALPTIPNLGFHASYMPAGAQAQVGGDWYDAFELSDGRILFSIGDVAGHGIEAAVIMSRARQAIISGAIHERDPAIVLAKANETLMLQDAKMVTAVCGYINPDTLAIVYATAGHPPPVLAFADGSAAFLEHDGIPLGIFPNITYRSFATQAREGSLLVLYTDGVIEHKRDLLDGEQRLLDAARQAVAEGSSDPAASVRFAIFADKAPVDDVAIMTVSFAIENNAGVATLNALSSNRLTISRAEVVAPPFDAARPLANGASALK